jgi:hypothetical protein
MERNYPVEALTLTVEALEAEGIDYAIMGSFAAAYHGVIRATSDVDVKVRAKGLDAKLEALRDRLRDLGFAPLDETTYRYRDRFDVELYPVSGEIDEEAFKRRLPVRLFSNSLKEFWIVSVEDLMLIKLREYRKHPDYKHVDDTKKLVLASRETLDVDYLEKRLKKHGFLDLWRKEIEP